MTQFPSLSEKAVGFLVWFRNEYGESTGDTYYLMADKYGQCNYVSCRNRVVELAEAGYMTISKINGVRRRYNIVPEKYNELVGSFNAYEK